MPAAHNGSKFVGFLSEIGSFSHSTSVSTGMGSTGMPVANETAGGRCREKLLCAPEEGH